MKFGEILEEMFRKFMMENLEEIIIIKDTLFRSV